MRNQGRQFEQAVQDRAAAYMHQRVLELLKVDPPTLTIGWGKRQRVIHKKNPFLDFVGTWTERGGRAIHLEAKSTREPRLPLFGKAHLTQLQAKNLFNRATMGAAVGIIWHYQGGHKMIGIRTLAKLREAGAKSIRWDHPELVDIGPLDFAHGLRTLYL